jgi:hypothetical protein
MPDYSETTSLKGDPDVHLKKALKKHKLDDFFDDVSGWLDGEPGSPGSLKKHWITNFNSIGKNDKYGDPIMVYWDDIDLKDPTTWGDPGVPMPSDQAFIDMYKAIVADEKRRNKRSSYEF